MRRLALFATFALAGCTGGDEVKPSINGVFPNEAFLARSGQFQISGYGTNWKDASPPTVEVEGAGVTVSNVTVASPTALVVDITVTETAAVGTRVLTVTNGSQEIAYGAFDVLSPAYIDVTFGTLAQGSVAFGTIQSLDLFTPFDTATDFFGTPLNILIEGPSGSFFFADAVSAYSLDFTILIDVSAAAGSANTMTISSGADPNIDLFPIQNAYAIAARSPIALPGPGVSATVSEPFGTTLYTATATGNTSALVTFTASTTDLDAAPGIIVLPKSGSFADLVDFDDEITVIVTPADPYFVIYFDNTGTSGYSFDIDRADVPAAISTESEMNNAFGMANQLTLSSSLAAVVNASMPDDLDEDWFRVPAISAGRRLHVKTIPGDTFCDTVVQVFRADGTTPLGPESSDAGYHEDHFSAPAVVAEDLYVRVSYSTFGFSEPNYILIITNEP